MLASFVQEVVNAPGVATTINLAGPPTGRVGFIGPFASGAAVHYVMEDATQAEWGTGTVTAGSPNTLARTTVIRNTAGTTARLNFTGSTRVYCALPGERMVYADASGALLGVVPAVARAGLGAAPLPTNSAGVGQPLLVNPGFGNALIVPAGGSWKVLVQQFNNAGAFQFITSYAVHAGGTNLGAPSATEARIGYCWRIA